MIRQDPNSADVAENADCFWSLIRTDAIRSASKQMRADMMVLGADFYLNSHPPPNQKLRCLKRSFLLWRKATRLVPTHDPHWTPYQLHNFVVTMWKLYEAKQDRRLLAPIITLARQLSLDHRTSLKEAPAYYCMISAASLEQCRHSNDDKDLFAAIDACADMLGEPQDTANARVLVGKILKELDSRRDRLLSLPDFRHWLDTIFPRVAILKRNPPDEAVCALVGALFQFYITLPVSESTSTAAELASAVFIAARRDWANLQIAYCHLGMVYRALFQHTQDQAFLVRAIKTMAAASEC
jgi:hypothetical protein